MTEEQLFEELQNKIRNIQWTNEAAKTQIPKGIETYGLPTRFDPSAGGSLEWSGDVLKHTPFFKVLLTDEDTMSRRFHPKKNVMSETLDVWSYFVKYGLEHKCISRVYTVDNALGYDAQKKLLWARGPDTETCIALLVVGTRVGNCQDPKVMASPEEVVEGIENAKTLEKLPKMLAELNCNLTESCYTTLTLMHQRS